MNNLSKSSVTFLIMAVMILIMTFTFSCSGDDGGSNEPAKVACQTAVGCVADTYTVEQCVAIGTVVASCAPNSSDKVPCEIAGVCVADLYTADLCRAGTGTVVASCGSSSSRGNGGGGSSSSGPGGGESGSCRDSDFCIEGYPKEDCEDIGLTFTINGTCSLTLYPFCMDEDDVCTRATASNKASCFANGGALASEEACDDVVPTPSSSSRSSSSGTPNTEVVAYCDYGLPNSSGGGCYPIYSMSDISECDTRYASLNTRCGTSGTFCRWTAGCWESTSNSACTADTGTPVSECPPSDYGLDGGPSAFYCLDPDASAGPTCTRIKAGGTYTGAKACLNGVGAKAAIVEKTFCDDAEAIIVN